VAKDVFVYPHRTLGRPFAIFNSEKELIDFLVEHGVRVDDEAYPLKFLPQKWSIEFNEFLSAVHQWTTIGWVSENT